ncbi:DUF262 domain-containing protein [Nannocystis pusilla]|uniref:DUF262 domain-containing protein n=1 Tax=Nannocystis pusilla TaxID=889268 RepID=UPI003B7AF381
MNVDGKHADEAEDIEKTTNEEPEPLAYPLDSLLIRTEQRTIQDVLRRIPDGVIKLDPDFQREFLWDTDRQSRLIESILMRIPLPVFYVAEDEEGKLVIVDGLQRLSTMREFAEGRLTLGLRNPEIDGKNVKTLPPRYKRRFEDGQLLFYIIDARAPERVRLDVFERVNSGVALTRQQMRNALYNGPATRLLRELSSSDVFKRATQSSLDKDQIRKEQRDREVINRYLAFQVLGWRSFGSPERADMDEFLGQGLRVLNRQAQASGGANPDKAPEVQDIRTRFALSMERNHRIFGRHAFCKHWNAEDRKHPFNVALFEVFSVLLGQYAAGRAESADDAIRSGFYDLMSERRFERSISAGTNKVESVRARFELAEQMLRGVG